jgi:flagellar basal body-associated protein FliL
MITEEIVMLICAFVSAVVAIAVAVIETGNSKHRKSEKKRQERRERETYLAMELQSATLDLAFVTSLAVTGGHTNGNVEEAQEKAKEAQEAYRKFLREETAHAVAKL